MTDTYNKGKDYLKKYNSLTKEMESLKAKVAERFLDLCTRYPDAPVIVSENNTIIKAKGLADKSSISRIPFDDQLKYITTIENWISNLEPYVQGNLFKTI